MAQRASGTVVLVTGANKGIGFHIARQLAQAGQTVSDRPPPADVHRRPVTHHDGVPI